MLDHRRTQPIQTLPLPLPLPLTLTLNPDHLKARGGEVRLNAPVAEMKTNDDGTVAGFLMRDGTTVVADEYPHAG